MYKCVPNIRFKYPIYALVPGDSIL